MALKNGGIMKVEIKREKPKNKAEVRQLLEICFEGEPVADVVEELRQLRDFESKLARVATINEQIIGYILLSPAQIMYKDKQIDTLLVSPVAVLPAYQDLGVGGELMRNARVKAKEMGYHYVIALGNQSYFERFGYRPIANYGLLSPLDFDADDNFQLLKLDDSPEIVPEGVIQYAPCLDRVESFQ